MENGVRRGQSSDVFRRRPRVSPGDSNAGLAATEARGKLGSVGKNEIAQLGWQRGERSVW